MRTKTTGLGSKERYCHDLFRHGKKRVEMTINIIIIYFIFHWRSVGLTINLLNVYKIWMCRKMSRLYKHTVARLKLYEFVSIEVGKP